MRFSLQILLVIRSSFSLDIKNFQNKNSCLVGLKLSKIKNGVQLGYVWVSGGKKC